MTDTYGLTALPVALPGTGASVGDPGRDVLLAFLSAVITEECGAAWAVRAPGETLVRRTHAHDPNEEDFASNDLPALFCYRGDGRAYHFADGEFGDEIQIAVLWVFPPTTAERQADRRSIAVGLSRAIHKALGPLNGRHPAWVAAGDTDPFAADYGSSLLTLGGFETVRLDSFREATVKIDRAEYPAFELLLVCREDFAPGAAAGLGTSIELTIEQNGHASPAFTQVAEVPTPIP